MLILKIVKVILMIYKTVYFNFRNFNFFKAIKLPVFIGYNVKIIGLKKNSVVIKSNNYKYGMIKFGFDGSNFIPYNKSTIEIKKGKLILGENIVIGEGFNIYVEGGELEIGNNLYSNRNLQIQCEKSIKIESDCLFGWNVQIRDTNGSHHVFKNMVESVNVDNIEIKKHVWVASDCLILAGTRIEKDNIIATKSVVKNLKTSKNQLVAGIPAITKDGEYRWKK